MPHDQPLKTQKELAAAAKSQPDEDAPSENIADLNAMFDQINNLPADDPLRKQASGSGAIPASTPVNSDTAAASSPPQPADAGPTQPAKPHAFAILPQKVLAAFSAENSSAGAMNSGQLLRAPAVPPAVQTGSNGSVVVDAGKRVAVPAFSGNDLRDVVEAAAGLGLRVQPLGSGLAHDQAPAAGTLVPVGTEVVVRFAR